MRNLVLTLVLVAALPPHPAKEHQTTSAPKRNKAEAQGEPVQPPNTTQHPRNDNAESQASKQREKGTESESATTWTKVQAVIAIIGALLIIVNLAISYGMLRTIKQQGEAIFRQAQAAQQSAVAAMQTADATNKSLAAIQASEAAFITVDNWQWSTPPSWGEQGKGKINIVNSGSTAATVTEVLIRHEIGKELQETPEYGKGTPCSLIVPANGKTSVDFDYPPIPDTEVNDLAAERTFVYFWGFIDWRTLFGKEQRTGFAGRYNYATEKFSHAEAQNYTYSRPKEK